MVKNAQIKLITHLIHPSVSPLPLFAPISLPHTTVSLLSVRFLLFSAREDSETQRIHAGPRHANGHGQGTTPEPR